jgi:hypothetical protein
LNSGCVIPPNLDLKIEVNPENDDPSIVEPIELSAA